MIIISQVYYFFVAAQLITKLYDYYSSSSMRHNFVGKFIECLGDDVPSYYFRLFEEAGTGIFTPSVVFFISGPQTELLDNEKGFLTDRRTSITFPLGIHYISHNTINNIVVRSRDFG